MGKFHGALGYLRRALKLLGFPFKEVLKHSVIGSRVWGLGCKRMSETIIRLVILGGLGVINAGCLK